MGVDKFWLSSHNAEQRLMIPLASEMQEAFLRKKTLF
jgi:hypothetical protein